MLEAGAGSDIMSVGGWKSVRGLPIREIGGGLMFINTALYFYVYTARIKLAFIWVYIAP